MLSIAKDSRPGHDGITTEELIAKNGWNWEFGSGDYIAAMLGITKIPHTIFIDAHGNVSHIQSGYMDKDAFIYQLSQIADIPLPAPLPDESSASAEATQ